MIPASVTRFYPVSLSKHDWTDRGPAWRFKERGIIRDWMRPLPNYFGHLFLDFTVLFFENSFQFVTSVMLNGAAAPGSTVPSFNSCTIVSGAVNTASGTVSTKKARVWTAATTLERGARCRNISDSEG